MGTTKSRYTCVMQDCKNMLKQKRKLSAFKACMELATLLYELPYYHAISSCVIDHMHCLFLGIAKHCFKTWMLNGVLQEDSLIVIRARVD